MSVPAVENTPEVTEEPGAQEETAEVEETEGDDTTENEEQSDDALPEWARTKLTKANAEAAKYRTQLRETEAKLAQAKTPEEFEAAVNDLRETNIKLTRTLIAKDAGLPESFADRLRGDTEEELLADAKALADLFPKKKAPAREDAPLKGGLTPEDGDDEDSLSPAELAKRYSRQRVRI